ncbi:MAG TPA: 2-oxoacid:acceptor oxidoreductase family protein [Dehalococcoidales bacterium]|nr:2-oxoacid:acceptor oxidoreductase family protein [Dehalococcoidales bacterium]
MQEILWHGRGGQGVVVASSILGTAVSVYEGKYAMSIPSFGAQRRGAPLIALTRVSDTPIRRRDLLADPDYIVILDDSLTSIAMAECGHEKPRHIIINSKKPAAELNFNDWPSLTIVDADSMALEVLRRPITNTVMVGAVAAVMNLRIDSVKKAIIDVLGTEIAPGNIKAAEAGFKAMRR